MNRNALAIAPVPQQIIYHRHSRRLELLWPDAGSTVANAAQLRGRCRCSGCEAQRRRGVISTIAADIHIECIEYFGVIGLQLFFSDGHQRGLFPWGYLREIGAETIPQP